MRTWGLAFAVVAALGLMTVGCDKKNPEPVKKDDKGGAPDNKGGKTDGGKTDAGGGFKYDMWAAWNSFDKGAWVEQETTSKFGDMPESKSSMKTTITSKDDKVVKGDRNMAGMDMKDQEIAKKPEGGGTGATSDKCPMPGCEKKLSEHKKPETKNSTDEIEVAGKKLKCDVVESTNYDCKGEKQVTIKNWYSKEIPGWIAKSESESFGQTKGAVRSVVTGFGTR